jgi:hypothetical protein
VSEQWGQPEQPDGGWSIPQPEQDPNRQQGQPPYDAVPSFGDGQQQYGQQVPPQPMYGQAPQYGAPQPGFDPAYAYPAYGPTGGSNGVAIAGFVLAIVFWPLGLILSIVGVVKSGNLGGKGRGLAIAGIAISVVFAILTAVLIFVGSSAPAADPGCTSAESQLSALDSQITADENDPTSLIADLNTAKTDLDSSLTQARHQDVHNQIQLVDSDLGTFLADYNSLSSDPDSSVSQDQLQDDVSKLQTDGDDLDTLCSTF